MNKSKLILIFILITVTAFIFKSSILGFLKNDIEGCTDKLAANYNPKATIDNGSCSYEKSLSPELSKKIQVLKDSDWDKNEYTNLKFEIYTYFNSKSEKGSGQEKISLEKLDMAYMLVLERATDQLILDCFRSSSNLKREVRKFYDKYKDQNLSIRSSQAVFNCYSQIYTYQKMVSRMLGNKYVKTDADALKLEINKFSKSKTYLKISSCKKNKKTIADCLSNLDKLELIESLYIIFAREYEPSILNLNELVPQEYFDTFKDFAWYYNKVIETDKLLKKEKIRRDSLQLLENRIIVD